MGGDRSDRKGHRAEVRPAGRIQARLLGPTPRLRSDRDGWTPMAPRLEWRSRRAHYRLLAMSRRTRRLLGVIGGVTLVAVLYHYLRQPPGPREITSSDGAYVLSAWINNQRSGDGTFHCVEFEIANRSGAIVHQEQTQAPGSAKWRIGWD